MAEPHRARVSASARRGAALLVAGGLVALLNLSGLGAPGPAYTAPDALRDHAASRTLPDRLDIQQGITVDAETEPLFDVATARATPPDGADPNRPTCISSPLPPGAFRISSNYGMRTNPITGGIGLHSGVDLAAPLATPIYAVADGTVVYTGAGKAGRSPELVIIDHDVDGVKFSSWYIHMYPDGVFVEAGQEVSAGEHIAEVGSNGFSTGPHLHLEIHSPLSVNGGKGASVGRLLPMTPAADALAEDPPEDEADEVVDPGDAPGPADRTGRMASSQATGDPEDESVIGAPGEGEEEPAEPTEDPGEGEETPRDTGNPKSSDPKSGEPESSEPGSDKPGSGDPEGESDPTAADDPKEDNSEEDDFEIEEDDDQGRNDHTIDRTLSRSTGIFDPSSLGVLHDPLPFLRAFGYGLAAPAVCFGR